MGMADCEHCWDTLCICGWSYRHWEIERIDRLIRKLSAVKEFKIQNPNATFKWSLPAAKKTEDEEKLLEHLRSTK
jgi:hypothetical protein